MNPSSHCLVIARENPFRRIPAGFGQAHSRFYDHFGRYLDRLHPQTLRHHTFDMSTYIFENGHHSKMQARAT
jgi:hypothetical protein